MQVFGISATSEIVSLITDFRTDCNISCTNFFDRKYKKTYLAGYALEMGFKCSTVFLHSFENMANHFTTINLKIFVQEETTKAINMSHKDQCDQGKARNISQLGPTSGTFPFYVKSGIGKNISRRHVASTR